MIVAISGVAGFIRAHAGDTAARESRADARAATPRVTQVGGGTAASSAPSSPPMRPPATSTTARRQSWEQQRGGARPRVARRADAAPSRAAVGASRAAGHRGRPQGRGGEGMRGCRGVNAQGQKPSALPPVEKETARRVFMFVSRRAFAQRVFMFVSRRAFAQKPAFQTRATIQWPRPCPPRESSLQRFLSALPSPTATSRPSKWRPPLSAPSWARLRFAPPPPGYDVMSKPDGSLGIVLR